MPPSLRRTISYPYLLAPCASLSARLSSVSWRITNELTLIFCHRARLFSGSFESAIYLLSMICAIPTSVSVLPAINTNFTHHICAGLADGTQIAGQVAISHPSAPSALPDDDETARTLASASVPMLMLGPKKDPNQPSQTDLLHPHWGEDEDDDRAEDANLPGSLPALARRHVGFSKDADDEADLPARIERLWYINPYGHEIWPVANPKALTALSGSDTVVYSVGSLYTSIMPSLVLGGIGKAIANPGVRRKVLVLNSARDRETGPRGDPMDGRDFVMAVARAAAGSGRRGDGDGKGREEIRRYVTHLVYVEGKGAPAVDEAEMRELGIECVKVAGKVIGGGGENGTLRYDEGALGKALEAIIDS